MADVLSAYPAPGQLVSVGSHKLHFQTAGEGSPTVILESGQAGFSLDWMRVLPEVAKFTRVVAYDRAGLGWSEPGPRPRTPAQIVSELHSLLTSANTPKPYLFAAHSLGGRYARLYASRYPDEAAGLVLVDPDSEFYGESLGMEKYQAFVSRRGGTYRLFDRLARLGLLRLFTRQIFGMLLPEMKSAAGDVRRRFAAMATRPGAMSVAVEEYEQAVAADSDLHSAVLPKDIPLRVLAHGIPWSYPDYEQAWQESLQRIAALSSDSRLIVADKSGHAIHLAQPEIVVDTIQQLVQKVRA